MYGVSGTYRIAGINRQGNIDGAALYLAATDLSSTLSYNTTAGFLYSCSPLVLSEYRTTSSTQYLPINTQSFQKKRTIFNCFSKINYVKNKILRPCRCWNV